MRPAALLVLVLVAMPALAEAGPGVMVGANGGCRGVATEGSSTPACATSCPGCIPPVDVWEWRVTLSIVSSSPGDALTLAAFAGDDPYAVQTFWHSELATPGHPATLTYRTTTQDATFLVNGTLVESAAIYATSWSRCAESCDASFL